MRKAKALFQFDHHDGAPTLFTAKLLASQSVVTFRWQSTKPDGERVFRTDDFDVTLSENEIDFKDMLT
jgi:hypothetical protein